MGEATRDEMHLAHEVSDDAVEAAALEAIARLGLGELLKVLGRLGDDVFLQLHHNAS
jgi:hypothetical protein